MSKNYASQSSGRAASHSGGTTEPCPPHDLSKRLTIKDSYRNRRRLLCVPSYRLRHSQRAEHDRNSRGTPVRAVVIPAPQGAGRSDRLSLLRPRLAVMQATARLDALQQHGRQELLPRVVPAPPGRHAWVGPPPATLWHWADPLASLRPDSPPFAEPEIRPRQRVADRSREPDRCPPAPADTRAARAGPLG